MNEPDERLAAYIAIQHNTIIKKHNSCLSDAGERENGDFECPTCFQSVQAVEWKGAMLSDLVRVVCVFVLFEKKLVSAPPRKP